MSNLGAQFDPGVPPEFGTTPIPEGHVRFSHYTHADNLPSIKEHGLQRGRARLMGEDYVFMQAGDPGDTFKRTHHFVEGHANANTFRQGGQLDIGSYGGERGGVEGHIEHMEKNRSTITSMQDIPASQIIATHEPWHEAYRRNMRGADRNEKSIMAGDYNPRNWGEQDEDAIRSVDTSVMALAAKVMVGGKLNGKSFADIEAEHKAKKAT